MGSPESQTTLARRNVRRRDLLRAAKFYLLAGVPSGVGILGLGLPVVQISFAHLGWWLGPWRSFPFPYESTEFVSPEPLSEAPAIFGLFAAIALTHAVTVAVLHSLASAVAVVAHIRFGWPPYWRDVRPRFRLWAVWAESIHRSWWAWGVCLFVWLTLALIAVGCARTFYPIIDVSGSYLIANFVAIFFVFTATTASVLQASLARAVGPDDLRCGACGYLLRGLEIRRCPECGYEGDSGGRVVYGLRWRHRGRPRKTRKVLPVVVVVALLLAPAWLPLGLISMPRSWLRFVPAALQPSWGVLYPNPHAFPIRLDAVCVIRHGDAVAVVRFDRKSALRANYAEAYWSDGNAFAQKSTPDTMSSGRVTNGGGPGLPIGPWRFSYSWASDNMLWLTRPDATYSVEAFTREEASRYLFWLPKRTP